MPGDKGEERKYRRQGTVNSRQKTESKALLDGLQIHDYSNTDYKSYIEKKKHKAINPESTPWIPAKGMQE